MSSLGELLQSEISSELDNALDGGTAAATAAGHGAGGHSGDDDIFKQLSDSSALLEQFFDFVSCDIKVPLVRGNRETDKPLRSVVKKKSILYIDRIPSFFRPQLRLEIVKY